MSQKQPNMIFFLSDDHTRQAMSCYGSKLNQTPNMDRIANEGARFDRCFCNNALCAPSRAAILTGCHSHVNGVKTLRDKFDGRQNTFPKELQSMGYQTAMVGKWHLGHGGDSDPTGFDFWDILEDQGEYFDSYMIKMGEEKRRVPGYTTDVVADISLEWLTERDPNKPFMLMCHFKAPHRPWIPDEKHAHMYEDVTFPYPDNFDDDYEGKAAAAALCMNKIDWLGPMDVKQEVPEGLSYGEMKRWKYQRFLQDYLRVVASVDDNIGRILDYLESEGLVEDTIVSYSSDQGFFLGEHGWFDKRFMYEEPLKMPFIMRYPRAIKAGTVCDAMTSNIDFAPTLIDFAGGNAPENMQGKSFKGLVSGTSDTPLRDRVYYRYYQHPDAVNVLQQYGMRTERYKIIHYFVKGGDYGIFPEYSWELFDLENDPTEMKNLYYLPEYAELRNRLTEELNALKESYGDEESDKFTYQYHAYK